MSEFLQKHDASGIESIRTHLIDYCLSHGLVVRPQPSLSENPRTCLVTHAPVALFPTPFPRRAFESAKSIQVAYNELYAKISMDTRFMTKIMEDLQLVDTFMRHLWQLYLEVKEEATGLTLGLFRSDYLLHGTQSRDAQVKQVEFNTISASFGALAAKTSEMHKAMHKLGLYDTLKVEESQLPRDPALHGLASGLAIAHRTYSSSHPNAAGVVFIVQAGERNAFDQRWLEYDLLEHHNIKAWRVPFTEVQDRLSLGDDRSLLYLDPVDNSTHEISVVYYRAGYGPEDYISANEWRSRKMLERSLAIKCPSIITQLAGSKKVQQVLSEPGVVEQFIADQLASSVRETFVALHALDDTEVGKKAIEIALTKPEKYVLKPQREGGGHNIYRDAIPSFLNSIPKSQWSGYILMELIEPPEVHNAILRAGEIFPSAVISELGIYGTILWNTTTGEIVHNEEAGHLLRTKSKDTDEGGVAAGFACIDSPRLID